MTPYDVLWGFALALFGLLAWFPPALGLQLRGVVVDSADHGIPGVLVEMWASTERLAGQITREDGSFFFGPAVTARGASILARRVGYAPAQVRIAGSDTALRIRLVAVAVLGQPLLVAAARALCPVKEEAGARSLWRSVQTRYADPSVAVRWASLRVFRAVVAPDNLGIIDTSQLESPGFILGDFAFQNARIREEGYAVPVGGFGEQRFDWWEYPRLESILAGHFITAVFGERHRLAVSREDEAGTTIVFCPRTVRAPFIEGRMTIGRDTSLRTVVWRFVTRAPAEEAGGQVVFAPRMEGTAPTLLPVAGLFWRKRLLDFYEEWMEYRRWHDCATEPNAAYCRGR